MKAKNVRERGENVWSPGISISTWKETNHEILCILYVLFPHIDFLDPFICISLNIFFIYQDSWEDQATTNIF